MPKLKKSLGFASLLFYSIGVIIGAGIYSVIGAAAGEAGEWLWLSFLAAAVIALFTAFSYAELSTMYPEAGAEYIFLREASPNAEWLRFGTGIVLTVAAAATATTVAIAFSGYMSTFVDSPRWLSALALLVFCTLLNIIGIKQATWVNILFTLIELLGLGLVVYWGVTAANVTLIPPTTTALSSGVLSGTAVIFFVYLGFEEIANLSEEAKNPRRDLPAALYISLAATTVLYVIVAIVVVQLVSPQQLATSEAPLSDAVKMVSPRGAVILAAIALFSTANTALITVISASRMFFSMARDGEAPRIFARILRRRKSPYMSAILILLLTIIFLPFGDVAVTASISSFGSLVAFSTVNIALLILARKKPGVERPAPAPFRFRGWPLTAIGGLLSIGLLLSQFDRTTYVVGIATALIAFVTYWLFSRWKAS